MDTSRNNQNQSGISSGTILFFIIFGIIILVGGFLAAQTTPSLFPIQASAESQKVDGLFEIMMFIGGIIFFLVQGLLVYSVIRFRRKPGDDVDGPIVHGNATLEIVWTIIPAIIVVGLSIASFQVWESNQKVKADENIIDGESIPIVITGQQFAWSVAYDTGEFDVEGNPITLQPNELHVYVGQNVHLSLLTNDVLHSFWIPAMRVKQDLIPGPREVILREPASDEESAFELVFDESGEPLLDSISLRSVMRNTGDPVLDQEGNPIVLVQAGRPTDVRFVPIGIQDPDLEYSDEEGNNYQTQDEASGFHYNEYPIICAELCGDGHGRMRSVVRVWESQEAFENGFYNPAVEAARIPPKDPIVRGEGVIQTYACSGCHALDTFGWNGITGPNLNGIGLRAAARVGGQSAEEYLVASIYNSNSYLVPGYGALMPQFGPDAPGRNAMSPEQLYAIVSYLCTETGGAGEPACDLDNLSTTIPAIVERDFGLTVDTEFGGSAAADTETTSDTEPTNTDDTTADSESGD